MNAYQKICPNVWGALCQQEQTKGDTILVTTKYGKENSCIVHNLVAKRSDGTFIYSITREDGFNSQERAKAKAERIASWADSADKKANEWWEKSNEGADFLRLGEPIKVGHHSEKRHRALIQRNWVRMANSMESRDKAEAHRSRISHWEKMASKVDLSMPESMEFFETQLEEAQAYHAALKDGSIPKEHSYSMTYAKKRVNELAKKVETARVLWA